MLVANLHGSPRRNSCVFPFFQLIPIVSIFACCFTFDDISGIYASCNTGGRERAARGRGRGVVRVFIECVGVDSQMLNPVRDRWWSRVCDSILRTDVSIYSKDRSISSVLVFIVVTAYVREAMGCLLRRSCKASLTGRTSCGISSILVTGKEIFKFMKSTNDTMAFWFFHNDGPMIFSDFKLIRYLIIIIIIYIYLFYEKFLFYFLKFILKKFRN